MEWREGVTVLRAKPLADSARRLGGRATAFNFAGSGGRETWIGTFALQPNANTGAHHHGRHEVAVYVARGRCELRWGESLEFAAQVGSGDFVYFAPNVPHQERNLSASETVDFVVVRSDGEGIRMDLEVTSVERPEEVF